MPVPGEKVPVPAPDPSFTWFVLIVMATAGIAFIAFLMFLRVPASPWYFLPIMAFMGVLFDAALQRMAQRARTVRALRLALLAAAGVLLFVHVWPLSLCRRTNVDRISVLIAQRCDRKDLIIVNPFYLRPAFHRYYRGEAPWVTVPEMDDPRFQFGDLRRFVTEGYSIAPTTGRIETALRGGHRVWMIDVDRALPEYPPAPDGPTRRKTANNWGDWHRQVVYFVQSHAGRLQRVDVPDNGPILSYEDMSLFVAEGWR